MPEVKPTLCGLIAATFTPLHAEGSINPEVIPTMVDRLFDEGVAGLYVCGSTGEGPSLTNEERCLLSEAFVQAADGRLPVLVQVGHNSLAEARGLAAHAQSIGAHAVSATCPSYYKIDDVPSLVDCMAEVARGAPDLPFYYYHIPSLTGVPLDMVEFLKQASKRIPNLAGLKFTSPAVFEYQACLDLEDGRFDVFWGCDEMLLSALAVGAKAAVGSTYNVAAPLYRAIMAAWHRGDVGEARRLQAQAVAMVRLLLRYPFQAAMKAILDILGTPCGPCRLPLRPLSAGQESTLRGGLESTGFFEYRLGRSEQLSKDSVRQGAS